MLLFRPNQIDLNDDHFMKYYLALILLLVGLTMAHAEIPLKKPSLRDQIGQMLLMGFDGKEVHSESAIAIAIEQHNIGGVILFDYNYQTKTFDKNIESPEQVRRLNHQLQTINEKANHHHHRPALPLLISVDYEGGKVNRLKKDYGFPDTHTPASVGKMNPTEAGNAVRAMAKTLVEAGFNLNFSPSLDVNINPDNPIIGQLDRSFSADPTEVATYGLIYATGFLHQGVQCAYKHFPGHGSSTADSHLGFVDVTYTWQDSELAPYQQLLSSDNACGMIMTAHIINRQLDDSGLPATLSHPILTGMLREQLGFKGIIITDDMQMKAISDYYGLEQALVLAINAGADMFIFGNQLSDTPQDPAQLIDIIEANVKSGQISRQRIEDAYERIVAFKHTLKSPN